MKAPFRAIFRKPRLLSSTILVVLCIVGSFIISGCSGVGGACAQALPRLEPSQSAPGETFRLYGGSGGFGAPCNDNPLANDSETPERNIRIELRQDDSVWYLDTVDANPDYTLDAQLTVPATAEPGPATILIHSSYSGQPLEIQFQVIG